MLQLNQKSVNGLNSEEDQPSHQEALVLQEQKKYEDQMIKLQSEPELVQQQATTTIVQENQ